ncbi:MAG: M28 family peptidase [Chloroflexi bacterium]|nr:M28 family peptidase [Chloroflexota bacterium]
MRGARAFVEYARRNTIAIREIVNFDNLGRGKLAARPSAEKPGFIFWLPLIGDLAYDGRHLSASPAYPRVPITLAQSLIRAQPDLVILEQFTARSDSNVFQADGIPTVAISGDDIFFLDQTWHTYADRVELLDERNLDLAFDLIRR